jgi:hypothetical protein
VNDVQECAICVQQPLKIPNAKSMPYLRQMFAIEAPKASHNNKFWALN